MPRFTADFLTDLKAAVPCERFLESRNVALTRSGSDLVGHCPLPGHDDDTPSFRISEKDGKSLWHCFGGCGGGDVISLAQKLDDVSFTEAVNSLASLAGMAVPDVQRSTVRPADACPIDISARGADLSRQMVDAYHAQLLQPRNAGREYLKSRGLDDDELIAHFRLGYAERGTLGKQIPDKKRAAGAAVRGELEKLGWFNEKTGHETLAGSVVVPLFSDDPAYSGVAAYGRKVRDNLRKGTPSHLYLKGQKRPLFNAGDCVSADGVVIVCEALIDALTFWKHGFQNVTTAYGVNGFNQDWFHILRENNAQEIVIAYDNDDAGNKAAELFAEQCIAAGLTAHRAVLPPGQDVNAYAVSAGADAPVFLRDAITNSVWLGGAQRVSVPAVPAMTEAARSTGQRANTSLAGNAAVATPQKKTGYDIIKQTDTSITIRLGNRDWRLIGLEKCTTLMALKVGLRVTVGDAFHQDSCDLTNNKQRSVFAADAGREVPVQPALLTGDLKKLLLFAEDWIEDRDAAAKAAAEKQNENPVAALSAEERHAALDFLQSPDLMERIGDDMAQCGLVGERVNTLTAYLAATSRRMARPLAVLVQSSSAAGKTTLMDAILSLMPEEAARRYSALSPKALYYLGADRLQHHILAIAEEEGAEEASYALKLLQSDGSLVFASPVKQPDGKIVTEEIRIDGPIMLFLTTTKSAIADSELENRCITLTVNEDAAQTAAIHDRQRTRDTWDGVGVQHAAAAIRRRHHNAQRLLQPVTVVNPYAPHLTFATNQPRLRRDHQKYLDLIKTITFLHQFQRPRETRTIAGKTIEAVLTTLDDIVVANELAHVVLGRCLDDLPPQPRRILGLLWELLPGWAADAGVAIAQFSVSLRQLVPHMPCGLSQLRAHLSVLVDREYMVCYRNHAAEPMQYRLLGNTVPNERGHVCLGLVDPTTIYASDAPLPDKSPTLPGRYRAVTGPKTGGNRVPINGHNDRKTVETNGSDRIDQEKKENCSSAAVLSGIVPKVDAVTVGR